jgi:8-oxo-dGTP pyrophosphatase MutT (NUDIX family)
MEQDMKTKSISAGVIVTNGDSLVLGHITNGKHWDIPKGGIDPGESAINGAIRELREETGLEVEPHQLMLLGMFDYKPKKDLILYCWPVSALPDPSTLKCSSTFDGVGGKQPELDRFAVVTWNKLDAYCGKDLVRVLNSIRPTVKEMNKTDA